jgi:hypothetical protein
VIGATHEIMDASGRGPRQVASNMNANLIVKTVDVVSHVPQLRESFAQFVWGHKGT